MDDFQGKKVFIVGGTSGLGFETARAFLKAGADVTVSGRKLKISEENESSAMKFIHQEFNAEPFSFSEAFLDALADCDILILSFGPFISCELHSMSDSQWHSMASMNFSLPGILMSRALNSMMKKGKGSIIVFGGTFSDSIRGYRDTAAYSAAKTALSVLVKSAAQNYAGFNIRCNALLPGFVTNVPPGKTAVSSDRIAALALEIARQDYSGRLVSVLDA